MTNETKAIGRIPTNTPTPLPPKGITHFLGIGINDYVHCPKLHNAVKDVQDTIALLQEKYGFDAQHIRTLYDDRATSEHILAEFKRLVREVKPTDNVLIYFSGHGELDDVLDEGFWVPVEAERGKENQYVRNSTIQKVLLKINSYHTFLISDSCYSGALFLDGKGKFVSDSYDFPSRWGLTSGRNTIVSDGKAGTNSPFATAILDTLRHIDKPLNVSALCDVVKQAVPAATNKLQKPIGDPLSIEGHKGGQFIFVPIVKTNPELVAWEAAKAENTEGSYSRYLRKYPDGEFADDADIALDILEKQKEIAEEEAYWQEVFVKNTPLMYHRYLRKYKNGKYVKKADKALDDFEMQQQVEEKNRQQAEAERKANARLEIDKQKELEKQAETERIEKQRLAKIEEDIFKANLGIFIEKKMKTILFDCQLNA